MTTAKGREKRRTLVKRDRLGIGLLSLGSFLLSFSLSTRGQLAFLRNCFSGRECAGNRENRNARFDGVKRSVDARSVSPRARLSIVTKIDGPTNRVSRQSQLQPAVPSGNFSSLSRPASNWFAYLLSWLVVRDARNNRLPSGSKPRHVVFCRLGFAIISLLERSRTNQVHRRVDSEPITFTKDRPSVVLRADLSGGIRPSRKTTDESRLRLFSPPFHFRGSLRVVGAVTRPETSGRANFSRRWQKKRKVSRSGNGNETIVVGLEVSRRTRFPFLALPSSTSPRYILISTGVFARRFESRRVRRRGADPMVAGCQRLCQRDPKNSKVEPARDRWNCDNDESLGWRIERLRYPRPFSRSSECLSREA